tara:strand:- start:447 stop:983 length:537 start_codon:yes stop_codon:yes gene_type:complete
MAFKMRGFPQHQTKSTLKQYTNTSSAFKQGVQQPLGGTDMDTIPQNPTMFKYQNPDGSISWLTKEQIKEREQERKNRQAVSSKEERTGDPSKDKSATYAATTKDIVNEARRNLEKGKSVSQTRGVGNKAGRGLKNVLKFGAKRLPWVGAGLTVKDVMEGKSLGNALLDNFLFGDLWRK